MPLAQVEKDYLIRKVHRNTNMHIRIIGEDSHEDHLTFVIEYKQNSRTFASRLSIDTNKFTYLGTRSLYLSPCEMIDMVKIRIKANTTSFNPFQHGTYKVK